MKKKKKRDKQDKVTDPEVTSSQVLLGVRVSEAERQKIKMYAVRHGVTIADLVRRYIDSLPEE